MDQRVSTAVTAWPPTSNFEEHWCARALANQKSAGKLIRSHSVRLLNVHRLLETHPAATLLSYNTNDESSIVFGHTRAVPGENSREMTQRMLEP